MPDSKKTTLRPSVVYLRGFVDPDTPSEQEPYVWVCSGRQTKQRRAPKNVLWGDLIFTRLTSKVQSTMNSRRHFPGLRAILPKSSQEDQKTSSSNFSGALRFVLLRSDYASKDCSSEGQSREFFTTLSLHKLNASKFTVVPTNQRPQSFGRARNMFTNWESWECCLISRSYSAE